jgi:hypothetical protein
MFDPEEMIALADKHRVCVTAAAAEPAS